MWAGLNGTWHRNPLTQTANLTGITTTGDMRFGYSNNSTRISVINTGDNVTFDGQFSTPATIYSDADGNGEFRYPVPTGFKALATVTDTSTDRTTSNVGIVSLDEAGPEANGDRDLTQLNWGGIRGRDALVGTSAFSFANTGILSLNETFITSYESAGPAEFHFLVIAGGGSGGIRSGGGGGAGGYRTSWAGDGSEKSGRNSTPEAPLQFEAGDQFIVTVGAGGASKTMTGSNGTQGNYGNPSVFASITSERGGRGGHYRNTNRNSDGGDGGSGGGAVGNIYSQPGDGTPQQGHDALHGGGGAGSTASGTGIARDGGDGLSSTITGSAVIRAGGGGGSSNGAGGSGGGGDAGHSTNPGTAGAATTGSGGGGAPGGTTGGGTSGAGGSGVVILRYPSSVTLNIPAGLTSSDDNSISGVTITTFTEGSGTVTVAGGTSSVLADILMVAGGGGGGTGDNYNGGGAGGGAGAMFYTSSAIDVRGQALAITIGSGGAGAPGNHAGGTWQGTSGGDTTLQLGSEATITAPGGGGGRRSGGSGGGADRTVTTISATANSTNYSGWNQYGNEGTGLGGNSNDVHGGGGGGAGGAGNSPGTSSPAGLGGSSRAWPVDNVQYAGGGGGGRDMDHGSSYTMSGGGAGAGRGGNGSSSAGDGQDASIANRGSGGGGGATDNNFGSTGGSSRSGGDGSDGQVAIFIPATGFTAYSTSGLTVSADTNFTRSDTSETGTLLRITAGSGTITFD